MDEQGSVTKSFRDIERLLLEFYKDYKRIPRIKCIPYITDWPCVTPQNISLVTRFSEEEIFKANKALGGNKAPSPDGFTSKFLVKHWLNKRKLQKSV